MFRNGRRPIRATRYSIQLVFRSCPLVPPGDLDALYRFTAATMSETAPGATFPLFMPASPFEMAFLAVRLETGANGVSWWIVERATALAAIPSGENEASSVGSLADHKGALLCEPPS